MEILVASNIKPKEYFQDFDKVENYNMDMKES